MDLTRDDIEQLICEVWAPSFELDLYRAEVETGERAVVASLEAFGSWDGWVVVRATSSFATAVAAKMFGLPRPEVPPDDAADAIGELANVVGGNLKSLLDQGEVDLGLPQLAGADGAPEGRVVARCILAGGQSFEVTVEVVERVPATV